jgi:hypothetical protein
MRPSPDLTSRDVIAGYRAWLIRHKTSGTIAQHALAFFDSLPCVSIEEITGRWRGCGFPTGHPMDGLLEMFGWWGKSFDDAQNVHPLLFETRTGDVHAVSARFLDARLLAALRAGSPLVAMLRPFWPAMRELLRTRKPMARLWMTEYRGRVTATMCYDYLPIHDVFRRVDENTLLGLMDLRGMAQPFFFVLARDQIEAQATQPQAAEK